MFYSKSPTVRYSSVKSIQITDINVAIYFPHSFRESLLFVRLWRLCRPNKFLKKYKTVAINLHLYINKMFISVLGHYTKYIVHYKTSPPLYISTTLHQRPLHKTRDYCTHFQMLSFYRTTKFGRGNKTCDSYSTGARFESRPRQRTQGSRNSPQFLQIRGS